MFAQSKQMTKVKLQTLHLGDKPITVLSAPSGGVYYDSVHEEPYLQELSRHPGTMSLLQYNPMNTMIRFRHIGHKVTKDYPHIAQDRESFEFEVPVVQTWEECHPSPAIQQYMCDTTKDTKIIMQNMHNNVMGNDFLRYPYINSCAIFAMIKGVLSVLVDIPEQLLRINVANSLSIEEVREIYREVAKELREHYGKEDVEEAISGYEVVHERFPHIFQAPRDRFTMSFIRKMAEENNVLAVVTAPTFVAMEMLWEKEKLFFQSENKCKERMKEDSDDTLIEKHVILDAIMSTKVWNDRYLINRFSFLDKLENIDEEKKKKYKEMFFKHYQVYSKEMDEILEPLYNSIQEGEGE